MEEPLDHRRWNVGSLRPDTPPALRFLWGDDLPVVGEHQLRVGVSEI